MALPTYVVNFDELVDLLGQRLSMDLDTSAIEAILNQYFPEIIQLLNALANLDQIKGTQKIKGFISTGEAIVFSPDKLIMLTGFTFSQRIFDGNIYDKWYLKIHHAGKEIVLLDGVYAKDALQHKYFERFYPVPLGYEIVIEPAVSGSENTCWFDLEYLEVDEGGSA